MAAGEGRHGVRGSIVGRIAALGGRAEVTGYPGAGTEVEITLPKRVAPVRIPAQDGSS
jgi:signal transduction histidine kinase